MTKLCSYCEVALERDDARFCQNCGKATSPRSLSPTASVDPASSAVSPEEDQSGPLEDTLRMPVVKKSRKSQPSLPEQIAQQPWSHRPATQTHAAKPQEQKRPAQESVAAQPPAQELPAEIADQHATEASASSDAVQDTPVPATLLSLNELPSTPPPLASEETEAHDQEPDVDNVEGDAIEELPSRLLEPGSAEALASDPTDSDAIQKDHADSGYKQSTRPAIVQPIRAKFSAFPDAVSRSTSPFPAVVQPDQPEPARSSSFPDAIRRFTSPLPAIVQSIPSRLSELPNAMRGLTSSVPAAAQSIPAKLSALPDALRELTPSIPTLPRTRQRLPMPAMASVLVFLVLLGIGSWLVFAQPFSVPQVTQPLLGFSDAHMGLSLLYPNGWTAKKDTSDSTVQFYDSSHTGQVFIAVSNINNSTITTALQKQSAQLGMSGAKSVASLSFAGASWQAMQGTVQQDGASYTCTILATTHANHLVIWTQLAPQGVYNQEEGVIFSAMRQSLRFL